MPPLSESWAIQYLGISVSLLVFAVGVPALLRQMLPEDLHSLSTPYLRALRLGPGIATGLITLGAMVFIWLFHPTSTTDIGVSSGFVAACLLSGLLVLFVVFPPMMRFYRRDIVARHLADHCRAGIVRSGRPDDRSLAGLAYLGEQGNIPLKADVLKYLSELVEAMQMHPSYTGDSLSDAVNGIERVAASGAATTTSELFVRAGETLDQIQCRLAGSGRSLAPDSTITLAAMGRLGVVAVQSDHDDVASAMLTFIAIHAHDVNGDERYATQRLAQIGAAALDSGRYLVAATALRKIEALLYYRAAITDETSADVLGLLAHFWASCPSARRQASEVLGRLRHLFLPDLEASLGAAAEHHYITVRFETADRLAAMRRDLEDPSSESRIARP